MKTTVTLLILLLLFSLHTALFANVDIGALKHTLTGHTDKVNSVAFSPAGNTLASASLDRTVLLWSLIPPAPVKPR